MEAPLLPHKHINGKVPGKPSPYSLRPPRKSVTCRTHAKNVGQCFSVESNFCAYSVLQIGLDGKLSPSNYVLRGKVMLPLDFSFSRVMTFFKNDLPSSINYLRINSIFMRGKFFILEITFFVS